MGKAKANIQRTSNNTSQVRLLNIGCISTVHESKIKRSKFSESVKLNKYLLLGKNGNE